MFFVHYIFEQSFATLQLSKKLYYFHLCAQRSILTTKPNTYLQPRKEIKLNRHFSDPASVLCGEHQGQASREHSRDVGDGKDRVRLVVWRETRRHDGPPPLSDSVPEPPHGGEKIQRPAGSADSQVRSQSGLRSGCRNSESVRSIIVRRDWNSSRDRNVCGML